MLPIRVVKVGGSLLEYAELAPRLRAWLVEQSPAVNVLVIGGGAVVDAIRAADQVHRLGEEASHWLAIRAMTVTAQMVAQLFPEATLVRRTTEIYRSTHRLFIFDVQSFMEADFHESPHPLPCSWDVTSDSIAARVADALGAMELVLLKSTAVPAGLSVEELSAQGIVDAYFPQVVRPKFSLTFVNLRA